MLATQPCGISAAGGACKNEAVTQFTPAQDFYLEGGEFEIKKGSSTSKSTTIELSLWQGNYTGRVGGTGGKLDGLSGSLLASTSVAASRIGTTYTPVEFGFASPVLLHAGTDYVLTLTSKAYASSYYDFTVRGIDEYEFQTLTPEPGTWLMIFSGLALAAFGGLRRRRA
jgi:hypothetical protein